MESRRVERCGGRGRGFAAAFGALLLAAGAGAEPAALPGSEEFGLTMKQLVQAVEKVEGLIATCMHEQGFQYIPADFQTVRRGMSADKRLPGMNEEEFIQKYGYGVATTYTGDPPQLAPGYSPARVGLGEQNVEIFRNLSPADRVAYNRALLGENTYATFAVGLETEDFSRTGGCTRKAIEQVFEPDQLKATYYNPKDALVNKHPRMIEALVDYASKMREAGFDYDHPDEVEADIRRRLDALTAEGTIPVTAMSPAQRKDLEELRNYERRVAVKDFELSESIFDPVEDSIQKEMYPRPIQ